MSADELLPVRQVADELQVNQQTIRNWLAKGNLRETRAGPRRVRVRRADLDAFLGAQPDARASSPERVTL